MLDYVQADYVSKLSIVYFALVTFSVLDLKFRVVFDHRVYII